MPDLVLEHISLSTFKNKSFGKLVIHIAGNSNNLFSNLKLQSCTGASMGLGISDYHAEFKNKYANDFTDVYYVSPILKHHNTVTRQDTQISFDYYTSGLNITKEQFAHIVKNL